MNTPPLTEAIILVPDLTGSKLPPSMIECRRWLNWYAPNLKKDDLNRFDKVPVGPTGFRVDAHDPINHRTFAQVVASYKQAHGSKPSTKKFHFSELQSANPHPSRIAGIAFDLPREINPWQESEDGEPLYLIGLDWDKVIDGNSFVGSFSENIRQLGSIYFERSPSGTGMRGFALTTEPVTAFNKGGFETYSAGRFLTITGIGRGQLARIDLDILEKIKREYGAPLTVSVPRTFPPLTRGINQDVLDSPQHADLPSLRDLLASIPASVNKGCTRDIWTRVIWAAKNAYGHGDETHEALLDWSMSSTADFDQLQFDNAWNTRERPDGVRAGTLIQIAKQFGWKAKASAPGVEQQTTATVEWDDPIPLDPTLPSVQSFTPDLLPGQLRAWVPDVAHRMQCPMDYPAVSIMVAISSLIGARALISPKAQDDWTVVPNLWGLIIGRPGVMKSPVLGQALKPLIRLEAEEHERWYQAMEAWQIDKRVAELAEEAALKDAKKTALKDPAAARQQLQRVQDLDLSPEPTIRRYVVNDASVEKLGEILQQNPDGLLVYRDEVHGLLTSLEKQGQEGARSFYLQAYDGNQPYTFDRIGRGTQRIERVCFSLIGGIQPGRIQEYVRGAVAGGSGDDGLLQRFGLTVWPDVETKFQYIDQWPDTPARQAINALFDRLNQHQPAVASELPVHRFTPMAQGKFAQWMEAFETEIRSPDMHPALVAHLAKYRKLIPALALIFKLIDRPDEGEQVDVPELERALKWATYLRSHAERLYAAAVRPSSAAATHLLEKLRTFDAKEDAKGRYFTARMIACKNWTGLTAVAEVTEAAALLVDFGWLQIDTQYPTGGGRPSVRYLIHPCLN